VTAHGADPVRKLTDRVVLIQFLRFAAVGGAGMLIDMAVLWVAMQGLGASPLLGRLLSFLVAATFTWALNRRVTFRGRHSGNLLAEWAQFLLVNAVGGLVNLGVYGLAVGFLPRLATLPAPLAPLVPYFGVACGSLSGLLINFSGSRKLVFRAPRANGGSPL
jgi:putative flippase GtrA